MRYCIGCHDERARSRDEGRAAFDFRIPLLSVLCARMNSVGRLSPGCAEATLSDML